MIVLPFATIAMLNAAREARNKRMDIIKRLEATMKPDPQYLRRCVAQLPLERRRRLIAAVGRV